MGVRVALRHHTEYRYDRAVSFSPHTIRLRPAPHSRTKVESYSLSVLPKPHFLNWQQDPYSNYLARLVFPKPGEILSVTVDLVVELAPINPFDFFVDEYAEKFPFQYDSVLLSELTPYLAVLPLTPKLQPIHQELAGFTGTTNDFLVAINQAIHRRVKYVIRMEPGVQAPEETLELGEVRLG